MMIMTPHERRASKDFSEAGGRPRAVVTGIVRIDGDVAGWQSRIRMGYNR
jgi:hypothetical protein